MLGLGLAGLVGAVLAAARRASCSRAPSPGPSRVSRPRAGARGGEHPARAGRRAREVASLAASFNQPGRGLDAGAGRRACLPPLGQPRAEDAADRDPGPRGGAPGRRARAPKRPAGDRAGGAPPRAPRRDLLDLARLRRSAFAVRAEPVDLGDSPRGPSSGTRQAARSFGVGLEALAEPDARAAATPTGSPGALEPRRERAPLDARGGTVRIVARPGPARRSSTTGPGIAEADLGAGVRALLPLRPLRRRPAGRDGPRPRDRRASSSRRWAARRRCGRRRGAGSTFAVDCVPDRAARRRRRRVCRVARSRRATGNRRPNRWVHSADRGSNSCRRATGDRARHAARSSHRGLTRKGVISALRRLNSRGRSWTTRGGARAGLKPGGCLARRRAAFPADDPLANISLVQGRPGRTRRDIPLSIPSRPRFPVPRRRSTPRSRGSTCCVRGIGPDGHGLALRSAGARRDGRARGRGARQLEPFVDRVIDRP